MYKQKNTALLIKRIKAATSLNQEGIAKKINYSRPHFSAMKKTNPDELYDLLESHFAEILNSNFIAQEAENSYKPVTGENERKVIMDVLLLEIAKLKSKVFGISVDDAVDELENNIKIALRKK